MSQAFDWDSLNIDFGTWEEERIWALDLPVITMDIESLVWHFDVPFWTNDADERWTIAPRDVIDGKTGCDNERRAVANADMSYPIDIIKKTDDQWFILDGIHRLVRAYQAGQKTIDARIIPRERLPEILTGEPFELPS